MNVTAAQTYGATCGPASATINDAACSAPPGLNVKNPVKSHITIGPAKPAGPGTTYSDADPTYDICSWVPSTDGGDGDTIGSTVDDYSPHHEPFEYYASTANPMHMPPASLRRAAAALARGCRSWWSPPGRGRTGWTTP